jgi:hypothetical protein
LRGDLFNVEGAFGDGHHEPECGVVAQFDRVSVHVEEYGCRQPSEPLVAIDQGMIVTIE